MSDFSNLADYLSRNDNKLKAIKIESPRCICCMMQMPSMVKIGAVIFCETCFKTEFKGNDEITTDSELYNVTYIKWLRKYQNL